MLSYSEKYQLRNNIDMINGTFIFIIKLNNKIKNNSIVLTV